MGKIRRTGESEDDKVMTNEEWLRRTVRERANGIARFEEAEEMVRASIARHDKDPSGGNPDDFDMLSDMLLELAPKGIWRNPTVELESDWKKAMHKYASELRRTSSKTELDDPGENALHAVWRMMMWSAGAPLATVEKDASLSPHWALITRVKVGWYLRNQEAEGGSWDIDDALEVAEYLTYGVKRELDEQQREYSLPARIEEALLIFIEELESDKDELNYERFEKLFDYLMKESQEAITSQNPWSSDDE